MDQDVEIIDLEFVEIGDYVADLNLSIAEHHRAPNIDMIIDGEPVSMPRVMMGYDPKGKSVPTRLMTLYDAVDDLYKNRRKKDNPVPILCHQEHMKPAGVCRVCTVEIETEPARDGRPAKLALVPACHYSVVHVESLLRKLNKDNPLKISTRKTSPRVETAVKTLTELLMTDYQRPETSHRVAANDELRSLADTIGVTSSRFPKAADFAVRPTDDSSLVISVDHNACIMCDRCVRACDDIKNNHVIGRAGKGFQSRIAFDLGDPMGESSCVECGECMISCPTGALSGRFTSQAEPQAAAADDAVNGDLVPPEEVVADELFEGISPAFLSWVPRAVVRRKYKRGDIVCREGEHGSTAFRMKSGKYEVRINSTLGSVRKSQRGLLSILGGVATSLGLSKSGAAPRGRFIPTDSPVAVEIKPTDGSIAVATMDERDLVFGEMTCMNHTPRAATIVAVEDSEAWEFGRNVLYMLQRSRKAKEKLDSIYRDRSLASHLRSVELLRDIFSDKERFQEFVDFLKPRVELRRYPPGRVIFRQNDSADHVYLVRLGFVKVTQTRAGGEVVLNYIGPGGSFGEIGLLSDLPELRGRTTGGRRTATCTALDHVELVRLTSQDFHAVLERFPQVRAASVAKAEALLERDKLASQRVQSESLGQFLSQGLVGAQSLLVLDLEKCTRCDECTRACADAHDDGVTRLIRDGLRFDKYLVASSCRSCMDPYCLVGCPVNSIRRDERQVNIVIEDHCIGCGVCAANCPYGNINMHEVWTGEKVADPLDARRKMPVVRRKATTCDLCQDVCGENEDPSCVYACPHDAAHRYSGPKFAELVGLTASISQPCETRGERP